MVLTYIDGGWVPREGIRGNLRLEIRPGEYYTKATRVWECETGSLDRFRPPGGITPYVMYGDCDCSFILLILSPLHLIFDFLAQRHNTLRPVWGLWLFFSSFDPIPSWSFFFDFLSFFDLLSFFWPALTLCLFLLFIEASGPLLLHFY